MLKIVLIVYGVLMLGGGVMGYAKAGSKMSLYMGAISSVLVFLSVFWMKNNPALGLGAATSTAGILSVVFLMRFLKTKAFMPSGMLLVLSLVVLAVCLMQMCCKKG